MMMKILSLILLLSAQTALASHKVKCSYSYGDDTGIAVQAPKKRPHTSIKFPGNYSAGCYYMGRGRTKSIECQIKHGTSWIASSSAMASSPDLTLSILTDDGLLDILCSPKIR